MIANETTNFKFSGCQQLLATKKTFDNEKKNLS